MKMSFIQSDWKGYSTIYAILSVGIGQLDINWCDDGVTPEMVAYLYNLQVNDKARGKGWGKVIVNALEEKAKAYNITSIHLTVNTNAPRLIEWYKSMGYEIISLRPFIFQNTGEERVEMRKELKYMDYDDRDNNTQGDVFHL